MAFRIAAASSDGVQVDYHFGQAKTFYIYEIADDGSSAFIESRDIERKPGHSEEEFNKVADLLHDCTAAFAVRVGPGAQKYLAQKGLRIFEAPYEIKLVLEKVAAKSNIFGGKRN